MWKNIVSNTQAVRGNRQRRLRIRSGRVGCVLKVLNEMAADDALSEASGKKQHTLRQTYW